MLGTPAPFGGAMTFTGNWLNDTFNEPFAVGGHEGNFQAYVNTLTIPAGATKSVLHYIVLGSRVTTATSDAERLKVETTAATLATTPDLTGLSAAQVCSVDNFSITADCAAAGHDPRASRSRRSRSRSRPPATTWSRSRSARCARTWSPA